LRRTLNAQIGLLILIGVSVITATGQIQTQGKSISANDFTQSESNYLNFSDVVWNMYNEDLNTAGQILDEYVKENISAREAMMATDSVYNLDSLTASRVAGVNPPEKFLIFHRDTTQAFSYLQGYMWNLAKFFETGNQVYASAARDSFNSSIQFKEKADKQRTSFRK
jgi:hypothetical protein